MANHSLQDIRNMVRELTNRKSETSTPNSRIDDAINTYMTKDMPLDIRNFTLTTFLEFYTTPNVAEYKSSNDPHSPLYDFKNKFLNVYGPVLFNGYPGTYSQDPVQWNTRWTNYAPNTDTTLRGNGTAGPYVGNVNNFGNTPVMQNNITFSTMDANSLPLVLKDYPINRTTGNLSTPDAPGVTPVALGTIDYITGAFTLTFSAPVPSGTTIYCSAQSYKATRPYAMLYYDGTFTVRPIPDQVYKVRLQADIKPTELLAAGQFPQEENWWELVALGAAIKVESRPINPDQLAILKPLYQEELLKVLRKTATQWTSQRASTFFVSETNKKYYIWPPYRPY